MTGLEVITTQTVAEAIALTLVEALGREDGRQAGQGHSPGQHLHGMDRQKLRAAAEVGDEPECGGPAWQVGSEH